MLNHLKLRSKLLLSLFFVASLSTITTTLFSISYFTLKIEAVALDKLRKNMEVAQLLYQITLQEIGEYTDNLAQDSTLRTLLGLPGLESRVTTYLQQLVDKGEIHQLIALNVQQEVVGAAAGAGVMLPLLRDRVYNNLFVERALREQKRQLATEVVEQNDGQVLAMTATLPVFKRSKGDEQSTQIIGVVMARYLLDGNHEPMERIAHLLGVRASLFFNRQVVSHAPVGTSPPQVSEPFFAPLLSQQQQQLEQNDLAIGDHLAIYRPLIDLHNQPVAVLGISESNAPYITDIMRGATTLIGLMVVCILGAFIIGYWLARSILMPIEQLLHGVSRVTSGDLSYEINLERKDELGQLAASFNSMAKQLQSLFNTLEQRVERSTRKLQNTLAHLSAIIDNLADGLLVTDQHGNIVRFNPSLTNMLPCQQNLIGQPCTCLLNEDFSRLIANSRQDTSNPHTMEIPLTASRIGQAVATSIIQKDSSHENASYPSTDYLGTVILIRDITHDKEIDNMLKNTVDTLTKVGTALSAETDLNKLLELFVVEACRACNADGATLYTLREGKLHYEVMINHSMNIFMGGASPNAIHLPPMLLNESKVSAFAAIHQKIIHAEDVYHNQEFDFTATKQYDAATGYHTRTMLVIPMLDRANQSVGVLQLINPLDPRTHQPAQFTRNHMEIVHSLASQAAVALENVRNHEKIERKNKAFVRFVPTEFLRHLGKSEAEDICLGDASQETMAVLFSDIRSFTSLSETMTPQANFLFLNEYLENIGPSIVGNGGFIDKYIGDAIMALFPGIQRNMADDALLAAIGMQCQTTLYNQRRQQSGKQPIYIGIGLHSGPLTLGTIGFEGRMETTVIGDTVNLASRMEGLTKFYGIQIGITDALYQTLEHPERYCIREIDTVQVKGKETPTTIYEVFDADEQTMRGWKQAHLATYHAAIHAYRAAQWETALSLLQAMPPPPSPDQTQTMYLQRCQTLLQNPPDKNEWTFVNRLTSK